MSRETGPGGPGPAGLIRPTRRGSPCGRGDAMGRDSHRRRRPLGRAAVAGALLALIALTVPEGAQAQTEQTLVSNLDTSSTSSVSIENREMAQQFGTGSEAAQLTKVETYYRFANPSSASRFHVSLWSSASDAPGERLATLTSPSDVTSPGVKTFTRPGPGALLLQPMTSYFVVFSFRGTSGGLFGVGTSDDAATGLTGWTMADSALARRHTSALTASWDETSLELGVRLRGSPLGGPVVTGLAITSEPAYDYGNYNHAAGDVIQATVTFNEAVTVQTTGGTPRLALTVGSNTRYANYSATVSTATELVFAYPVTVNDKDEDGISIVANALELNGGAIHEQGDTSTDALLGHGALPAQAGHLVNAAPVIVSGGVEVISTPAATTDTYGADETIEIQVEFSEAVTATADTDFVLSVGSAKRARLLRDNDTTKLVFGYTVQAGDEDDNGIWIGDHDRTLVGNRRGDPQNGEITSLATGRAADLRHGDLRTQSGHKVNGDIVTPRVTIAVADPDRPAFTAELDSVTFTLERTGSTAAALDVDVALTQDREFLATEYRSPTVAFQAGESSATLTVRRSWFEEVDRDGTLTATVQPGTGYVPGTANSATAQMLVVPVAVTVRLDQGSYAFDENAAAADRAVTVIARTEPGIPRPLGSVHVSFVAIEGEARFDDDFEAFAEQLEFLPSDFSQEGSVYVARKAVELVLVDDALVEDAETLTLNLQTARGHPGWWRSCSTTARRRRARAP